MPRILSSSFPEYCCWCPGYSPFLSRGNAADAQDTLQFFPGVLLLMSKILSSSFPGYCCWCPGYSPVLSRGTAANVQDTLQFFPGVLLLMSRILSSSFPGYCCWCPGYSPVLSQGTAADAQDTLQFFLRVLLLMSRILSTSFPCNSLHSTVKTQYCEVAQLQRNCEFFHLHRNLYGSIIFYRVIFQINFVINDSSYFPFRNGPKITVPLYIC